MAGLSALAVSAVASPGLADVTKPRRPAASVSLSHPGGPIPLLNGEEQTVSGTEKYVYDQDLIYWSVTALRSEGGKPTLSLFADEAGATLLAKSSQRKKKPEFIAVDSNHAGVPASYFPTAKSKNGTSTIELDNDAEILFDDTPIIVEMTAADVVKSVDVFLEAGAEYRLEVTGDGDAGLFLMQSDAEDPSTWYQSRAEAAAFSDKRGAGKTETITFVGTDDWYGLILINNNVRGRTVGAAGAEPDRVDVTYSISKTISCCGSGHTS